MKFFTALLVAIFLITGCSKQKQKESKPTASNTKETEQQNQVQANKYILTDINGKKIKIELQGNKLITEDNKIILLDFFATWCPPCRAEIPNLVDLQKKYRDKIEIIGIALNQDRNPKKMKDFIDKFKINYFVSISNDNYNLAKKMYALVQAPSDMPIPFMAMFKNSKYVVHYLGATPEEMIESDIKNAIGE